MKYFLLFFALFLMIGCSPTLRHSYAKLSSPEKNWVALHSLKAKRAFLISKEVEKVADSIAAENIIGDDNNGGHLDAFKHSFWMARLTQSIGINAALSLGKAHEKGNYLTFKKERLEDGWLPDKASSEMDLFNNSVGSSIGIHNKKVSRSILMQKVLDSLQNGKLRILNKDVQGNFIDCQQNRIPLDSLKNKWDTKKCLISSKK
jgi:hypothetical protein